MHMDGTSKWSDECLRQQRILGTNALVGAWVCMHVYVYVYAHVYVYVCVRILGIHASVGAWVCIHMRSTIHMVHSHAHTRDQCVSRRVGVNRQWCQMRAL